MIPPLAPEQNNEQQNMVGWKNTFNMRQANLMNLAASQIGSKNGLKSDLKCYMKTDGMAGPTKSLDILRRNLQSAINKDIDHIIRKYLDKFFQPAVKNIRTNLGKDSVSEDHIKVVCRQMLEDAKMMYRSYSISRDSSPFEGSDTEICFENRFGLNKNVRKRKESDTDSETGANYKRQRFRNTYLSEHHVFKHIKREGPKWSSDRITPNTLFIMGSRANKALGYGQTRGRLYVRHPELLRYLGDQEDKDWLTSRNLMSPSGGKAYIMILDDIKELAHLEEYKNNSNQQMHELVGFEAPAFLVNKIKNYMDQARTDRKNISFDMFDFHSPSMTPPIDSAPSTPSDTMQLIETQSLSTSSSKHSIDGGQFLQNAEISPDSNHSMLAPSPLPTNSSLLSPNMLLNIANTDNNGAILVLPENSHNGTSLSSLLASASDNSQEF